MLIDGSSIAKWTRSRGFEMAPGLQQTESGNQILGIASDSLNHPQLWLLKMEYKEGRVVVLWRTRLPLFGSESVQDAMRRQFKFPHEPFKGWAKGRYWEVVVTGDRKLMADGVQIRTQPRSPFGDLKLSHQLALLLHIWGPLAPARAAKGLAVREQQVKGAAAALARNELIVKGHEPYTPTHTRSGAPEIPGWLHDEFGDRMPAWVETLLNDPSPAVKRAHQLKQRST